MKKTTLFSKLFVRNLRDVIARDVEAVEYFLLPLPVRIKLVAFEFASTSSFFLQSASAFTKI